MRRGNAIEHVVLECRSSLHRDIFKRQLEKLEIQQEFNTILANNKSWKSLITYLRRIRIISRIQVSAQIGWDDRYRNIIIPVNTPFR